jgi:putative transposase
MEIIDKQFLEAPWYGSRQMARHMKRHNYQCGRHRVSCRARRLMRLMRLVPIYQEPNTSKKHPQHNIWPYLLRNVVIDRPNQVRFADSTYMPMRRGFPSLLAIHCPAVVWLQTMRGLDWHSRKVLAWRLSNSMDADFCVEALKEALTKYGKP